MDLGSYKTWNRLLTSPPLACPCWEWQTLTKTFTVSLAPDEGDLIYRGPSYEKSEGTKIEWKKGKDVTVKLVKKKQRKKGPSLSLWSGVVSTHADTHVRLSVRPSVCLSVHPSVRLRL